MFAKKDEKRISSTHNACIAKRWNDPKRLSDLLRNQPTKLINDTEKRPKKYIAVPNFIEFSTKMKKQILHAFHN